MKRQRQRCLILLLFFLMIAPFSSFAYAEEVPAEQLKLRIATTDTRPLALDRLLYTAFQEMDCQSEFPCTDTQLGYEFANTGERDGVISPVPNMEELYSQLKKVPVPLEDTYIHALIRVGDDMQISGWDGLAGKTVGILAQESYIKEHVQQNGAETVIPKDNNTALFNGLAAGEYDVAVLWRSAHEKIILPDTVKYAGIIDTLTEYLYLNKKHQAVIPRISTVLRTLFADGRAEDILNDVRSTETTVRKTILHIITSGTDIAREDLFTDAMRSNFKDDERIEWYPISLYSKQFSDSPDRLLYYADILRRDSVSRDIAAIIVSGDEALDFLKDYYYLFFRNIPVLFYGISEDYNSRCENYAPYFGGIHENLSAYETVTEMLSLFPNTKNLYVLNDYSPEGISYRKIIERQLQPFAGNIHIQYNDNLEMNVLLSEINTLPEDSIVLTGSYFLDASGRYYSQKEVAAYLDEYAHVPVASLYSAYNGYDALGGKMLDYQNFGEVIAGMLEQILDGEDTLHVISDSSEYNVWVFDKIKMDDWGIKENALPEGTRILNKKLSLWQSDPKLAYSLLALFVLGLITVVSTSYLTIRHRKQKELLQKDTEIRTVKERLEKIIDTAPLAYMLTIDGKIVEANEYLEKNMGVKVGDRAIEMYTDPVRRDDIVRRALSRKIVKNQVVQYKMPKGNSHRFLANASSVDYEGRRGIILWAMDSEENERKKDQLNMVRQNLQTLLDTLPVPVRIVDSENGEIVYVNNKCFEMFEFSSSEEMCGRHITSFMPEFQSDGTTSREKVTLILGQEDNSVSEIEYVTATGKRIDARIINCVISYHDRKSSVGIIADLREEKEYTQRIQLAMEKEREANKLKSTFLSNMSHEIRTPMNAIIGLTELELRREQSDKTLEIYKKINISANNLLQIVNDILDLSKIEADKLELYSEEFVIEEVLDGALLVVSPRLNGKPVELLLDTSPHLPRAVIGDRTRLWQILKNYLDNAAKYTQAGMILLTVSEDKALSTPETVAISFTVKDTGIGMDKEQLEKAFLPYEQIQSDAQRRYTGTGLGMPISKQLCELMGGSMDVASTPGQGTVIRFTIPFLRVQETQEKETTDLSGLKILAVDDNEISLRIMQTLLESNGANCITAESGKHALKIITKQRQCPFDIIVLDYLMGEMDGIETAKRIREVTGNSSKIVMVTASEQWAIQEELKFCGIDTVIGKPFTPTQFIGGIRETLGYAPVKESRKAYEKFASARVLVCEDNEINQEVVSGMLGEFGIIPVTAENGKRGLEVLSKEGSFDLVLMDLHMPVMDGYETTQRIRSDPKYAELPIISLTADAMFEVINRCLESGMNDYLAKPIAIDALYAVCQKWLPADKSRPT